MSTIEQLVVASKQLESLEHLVSALASIGAVARDLSQVLDAIARVEADPVRQATFMRLHRALHDFALATRHAVAAAPAELLKATPC